jgi:hypothetical protein
MNNGELVGDFFFIVRLPVFFGILFSTVEDWLGVMPSRVVDLFAC